MEPRRIIKFGNSSYVVTLPLEWLQKNNVSKGDILHSCEKNDSLIFYLPKENNEHKAKIIFENQPLKLLNKELLSYYLNNYKFIEISGEKVLEKLDEIRTLKEKISSIEIIEILPNKIVLQDLSSPKDLNLSNLISEIIQMETLFFEELTKPTVNDNYNFFTQLDSNINKLSFLAQKAINYHLQTWEDPSIVKDSISYWRIVSNLEVTGDILKRVARYLKNEESQTHPEISKLIDKIKEYFLFISKLLDENENFEQNIEIYLDKKQTLLREIEESREEFKNQINLFLVLSQLFKDIIGNLDTIVISTIDISIDK